MADDLSPEELAALAAKHFGPTNFEPLPSLYEPQCSGDADEAPP